MQVVHTFDELAQRAPRVCLAIGVFDGVHLGHQQVIGAAREAARAAGGAAVVLTFDPHPMRVLTPDRAPRLLTSTAHKLRLLGDLGVDLCLVLTFNEEFARTTAEEFIDRVARETRELQEICVGSRFRFGGGRTGDVKLIERLAPRYGFRLREIPSVRLGDEAISSTAVRQHLLHGRLERAAGMLGRPFSVLGTVVAAKGLGRQIGFPTANLNPHNEVLPPNGVYVVRAQAGPRALAGVANIGVRPTVEPQDARRVLEVHLLDFQGELYGQDLEVAFLHKLREEKKFGSVEELTRQIAADIQQARERFAQRI